MTQDSSGSPASIEMIRKLVGFPTVSRNSNLELIEFARARLAELGAEARLTHNDERTKANLFATLGPRDKPGIVLSGHTDVVPVDGQAWDTDPFELTEKDGRTYLEALCEYNDQATRDMVVDSGMETGMQESYDALEQVAVSLAQAKS